MKQTIYYMALAGGLMFFLQNMLYGLVWTTVLMLKPFL
jgi:uncharacterized membrane protein